MNQQAPNITKGVKTRKEASFFRALIEYTRDPVYVLRPSDGYRMVYANRAACAHFGKDMEELLAMRIPDWDPVFDMGKVDMMLEEMKQGKLMRFETVHRVASGELVPVEVTASYVVHDGEGMCAGYIYDISGRKQAEDALRKSEERYRTLFEESRDAIAIVDAGGRIIDANAAGAELFGCTREELLDMSFPHDFGMSAAAGAEILKTLAVTGFLNDFELELQKKDGGKVTVLFTATVIRNEAGAITGYRGIAHDITERKRLERHLMQTQKLESIGMLAGGVAHDFNNLLTAISGYGETILDNIPAEGELLRDSVEQVLKAASRAAELARSLLAFSRKQVIYPQPVRIHDVISDTGKLIKRIIGEDIQLGVSLCPEDPLVMADTGQIEQVLMNIAANAREAMPHGGCLRISTREVIVREGSEARYDVTKPGKYVRITISDTGAGIEEQHLGRIFEPFFTTKEIGKGTGLGLSMTYGAIKQHNGSILVKSEPGNGTTFSIHLPVMENGDAVCERRPAVAASSCGGAETLLVAEDEEMVRTFMKKIFERAGYRVIVAADGVEAMERFRENGEDISLILSDVVMPRKNGREILEEVRKTNPGMKVIFISGYTADVMHEKGIFGAGVDFVTKPFSKDELLRKVRAALDRD